MILFSINHLFAQSELLQVLLSNSNSFTPTQLNIFKVYYVIPIIQFLHTGKWFQVLLCNTNNSI